MNVERHQAVVIGGGPAGLAAAIQLKQKGIDDVVVLEREHRTGGILRQCIHDGFGLTRFGETLSGPEYAQRFVDQAEELGITCLTDTTVLSLEADRTVTASGHAGIYTAGVAQEYINLCNLMVGREVVILGSGDIGLIMARRMTLEGAHVKDVYEVQPYPRGLPRNIEQCLNDYNIPLHLSHTVTDIPPGTSPTAPAWRWTGAPRAPLWMSTIRPASPACSLPATCSTSTTWWTSSPWRRRLWRPRRRSTCKRAPCLPVPWR